MSADSMILRLYRGAVLLLPVCLASAQQPLKLMNRPPIRKGVAALPRIAAPNAAGVKINAALARQDAWVRGQAEACSGLDDQGREMYWERVVDVTKTGPALLSFSVGDGEACGGVHPANQYFALVYDLRTGDAVRWDEVFPRGMVKESKTWWSDGMRLKTIQSERLRAFYEANYVDRAQCTVADVEGIKTFLVYPDDKEGALELFPVGLPQVQIQCDDPVALDEKALASLGVSKQWRNAILGRAAKRQRKN